MERSLFKRKNIIFSNKLKSIGWYVFFGGASLFLAVYYILIIYSLSPDQISWAENIELLLVGVMAMFCMHITRANPYKAKMSLLREFYNYYDGLDVIAYLSMLKY
ncbi:hypothetical protein [Piscirickettsia salmonis]|nr:hypothetical protein [Piscirickettsia salmonis]